MGFEFDFKGKSKHRVTVKMEGCPARFGALSQLFSEHASEMKSRFWHVGYQSHPRAEIICPEPRHASRIPHPLDNLNRHCMKPKGITTVARDECNLEVLDIILNEDDGDRDSSNQICFLPGSPPVRSTNPIVRDARFVKQTIRQACPLSGYPEINPPCPRFERAEGGSPDCSCSFGVKPNVRIEGFDCGNSEPRCVLPTLARSRNLTRSVLMPDAVNT